MLRGRADGHNGKPFAQSSCGFLRSALLSGGHQCTLRAGWTSATQKELFCWYLIRGQNVVQRAVRTRAHGRVTETLTGGSSCAPQAHGHVRRGVPGSHADALLQAPCVTYLHALALGALALEWACLGGIEGAKPNRVANDVLDVQYQITALWVARFDRQPRSRSETAGRLEVARRFPLASTREVVRAMSGR